jgi:hypothetical protein
VIFGAIELLYHVRVYDPHGTNQAFQRDGTQTGESAKDCKGDQEDDWDGDYAECAQASGNSL